MICIRCKKDMGTFERKLRDKVLTQEKYKCQYCGFNSKRCHRCQQDKISIKKRNLCGKCNVLALNKGELSPPVIKAEYDFAENYCGSDSLLHHNATFKFNGLRYTPDFYDVDRDVFIEVVASFVEYKSIKLRTSMFKKYYPNLGFEIRYPNGEVVPEYITDYMI